MAFPTRRLLPFALVVALAATACSNGKPNANHDPHFLKLPSHASQSGSPHTTTLTPSPGTSTSAKPSGAPSSAPTSGTSAKPGTSTSPSAKPKPKSDLKVSVVLANACVAPGGEQTATVKVSAPDVLVIVDTVYADNKEGQTHGGFQPQGKADAKGIYIYKWTVLPGTPVGVAKTIAAAGNQEHRGNSYAQFEVKAVC